MFIKMEKPAAAICGTNANASVNRSVTAGVPGGRGPVATSTSASGRRSSGCGSTTRFMLLAFTYATHEPQIARRSRLCSVIYPEHAYCSVQLYVHFAALTSSNE
jgi:hypothetical protein